MRLGWDCTSQALKLPMPYNKVARLKSLFTVEPKPMATVPIASIGKKSVKWRSRLTIPVIANGEIWRWEDGQACLKATGCEDLMVGRGALNIPNLSLVL